MRHRGRPPLSDSRGAPSVGARLFFRKVDGGFRIVGKSDKPNESDVIKELLKIYGS
ncbi:hypothetical protein EDD92_6381 [Streptomyces sp. TLI_185]|nr:hypothetical protein EDD92_6381 [Streptomyces sp. TLI_185]